jgi:L-lactate dehydrogenase complex protein LldG
VSLERDRVIEPVRAAVRHAVPHPGPHPSPPGPADFQSFAARVRDVGGEAHGPLARARLGAAVAGRASALAPAGRRVAEPSAAELVGAGGFEPLAGEVDPRSLADVRVAVVKGALGVVEGGAVAVLGRDAPHRAVLFLTRHLILVLEARCVVGDLHAAFRALPGDALRDRHLTWISGPSKTADIEQTLVLGAHGPYTLDVFGYDAA